jgi:hypothetical protein
MFKKFFGKKNDGFFMQIDESAPPKAAATTPEAATKSKVDVPKADVAAKSVPEAMPANTVVAAPEAVTEQKTKSAKTSIKKDKKDDKKQEKATVQPEVVAAEPVASPFTNFATDYLVTPAVAGDRRRPSANMKGFISMARDVKDMKKGSQGNQIKQKAAKKTEA